MAEFDYAGQFFANKQQKSPETTDDFDYASAFFSGQRATSGQQAGSGQFPELGPKPITDPSRAAGFGTSFVGGIPTDKQAAIKYFAQKRGIPVTRYTIVDGDIAYQADDGKYYKEIAGPASTAAYYAPDVAEMVPDILAGVASAPLMMGGPFGIAAGSTITGGTAAGANYLRQKLGGLIGGQEVNPAEVAISGVLSGAAELAPAVRRGFVERRTARDIAQMNVPMVQSLRAKAGRLDVPLTPAELTSLASLTSQQKVITNVPESQVKMQQFYREREKKVQRAVNDYLGSISKIQDQAEAGSMGFDALQATKQQLIDERKAATEPLYTSAFAASVPVDTAPVIGKIDNFLKTQPANGRAASYLKKMKGLFEREVPALDEAGQEITKKGIENRLPILQNIKFELDSMFNEDAFKSLDTKIQSNLTEIKNTLVQQMGKDNPDYLAANVEFERLSLSLIHI
jgi:DnaJ-domain-containing protein 1